MIGMTGTDPIREEECERRLEDGVANEALRVLKFYNQIGPYGFKDTQELTNVFIMNTNEVHEVLEDFNRVEELSIENPEVVELLVELLSEVSKAQSMTFEHGELEYIYNRLRTLAHWLNSILKKYGDKYDYPYYQDYYPKYKKKEKKEYGEETLSLVVKYISEMEYGVFDDDKLVKSGFASEAEAKEFIDTILKKIPVKLSKERLSMMTPDVRRQTVRDNLFEIGSQRTLEEEDPTDVERKRRLSMRPLVKHLYPKDEDYEPEKPFTVEDAAEDLYNDLKYKVEELARIRSRFRKEMEKKKTEELRREKSRDWVDTAAGLLIATKKRK